jgi:hypothetical protein
MEIDNKLNKYLKITGTVSDVFRPKKTRIKLYNTLALPTLFYGSENWTTEARDERRITAAEMNYMRRAARYSWTDHKRNAEELNVTPVLYKIQDYKGNWIQHINRTPRNRLPRLIKELHPKGIRNQRKRLLDG